MTLPAARAEPPPSKTTEMLRLVWFTVAPPPVALRTPPELLRPVPIEDTPVSPPAFPAPSNDVPLEQRLAQPPGAIVVGMLLARAEVELSVRFAEPSFTTLLHQELP